MDANVLAILGILVGIGAGGAFVFLENANLLKIPWVLGLIGLISVAAWTVTLWYFIPILAVAIGFVGTIWVIAVVSTRFRQRLRQLGQGWQLPIRSPRKSKLVSPAPSTADPITEEQKRTLAAYEDILESDEGNLISRVLVWRYETDFANVTILGGWIDFNFDVFNGSILKVHVCEHVRGYLKYQGVELHDPPQPETSQRIAHGEKLRVTIRQKILPQIGQAMINGAKHNSGEAATQALFDFSGVIISMDSKTPLGMNGPSYPLPVNRYQKFRLGSETPDNRLTSWERITHVE